MYCFLDQQGLSHTSLSYQKKTYKIFTADLAQATDCLEHKRHCEKRDVFSVSFPLDCKWCHPAPLDESVTSELVVAMSFTNATMKFFMYKVKCICPLTAWVGFVSRRPLVQAWGSQVFLCIWSSTLLWLFLETWGWTFFSPQTEFKSASLSFDCLFYSLCLCSYHYPRMIHVAF